ncbi:unnamed protein product [Sphagnum balticum]
MGGRCRADRELFDVPSLRRCQHDIKLMELFAWQLPLSLLKSAQGHPMEDFCHPRCQVLTRSSFASDMDSGHSRMGIDSGECLNVIFEVIDKVQEETVKWSGLQLVVKGGLVVEKVRQGLFCFVLISAFFL